MIESGPLDSTASPVPDEVFEWTRGAASAPRQPTDVSITFLEGLPIAIDDEHLTLCEILHRLNVLGGSYGVGRFNGVEGTRSLTKSHEVREAPGALAVLTAHRHLEQLVLTDEELSFKMVADQKWTQLAVLGEWHTPLKRSIEALQKLLSKFVSGQVGLVFSPGSVYVSWLDSEFSLAQFDLRQPDVGSASHRHLIDSAAVLSRIRSLNE